MIFGFNTDVKSGDAVYHVQTEVRPREQMLETQVFMAGRCIGKRSRSVADRFGEPGFACDQIQEMARAQHREMVEAARKGLIEMALDRVGLEPLHVDWMNPEALFRSGIEPMRLKVSEGSDRVHGARVTVKMESEGSVPRYAQATSEQDGTASIEIGSPEKHDREIVVLMQATHNGRSVTRKYRVRRTENA